MTVCERILRFVSGKGACVIAGVATLGGCQQLGVYENYTAPPINVAVEKKDTAYDRLDAAIKDRTPSAKPCFADSYRADGADAGTCLGQRNQLISYLMAESVALCAKHVSGIYGTEAGFNIATGSIAALTSGIAAISTGTRAATLSAISSFTSAERALVNESVYKNLLTTAIATKIEQSRATLGKALLTKKAQPYSSYRIEDAIYDVIEYHHACSFYKGMELALAEGTNTNPATKLALLETRQRALAQEIDVRAMALRLDDAARKSLLDPKGVATSGDPVLKSLVERYQALQQEILATAPAPAAAPKAGIDAAVAEIPSLDPGADANLNPLLSLVAADATVKSVAAGLAGTVKKRAEEKQKTLTKEYLAALGDAASRFAASFRAAFFGPSLAGDPDKGALAGALKVFRDAQNSYAVGRSGLDLDTLAGRQKEVDLVAGVKKAALALADRQAQVRKCETSAKAKLAAFAKAQTDTVDAKSNDQLSTVKAIVGDPPTWSKDDAGGCLAASAA